MLSMLLGSTNHDLLPEQWQAWILPAAGASSRKERREQRGGA